MLEIQPEGQPKQPFPLGPDFDDAPSGYLEHAARFASHFDTRFNSDAAKRLKDGSFEVLPGHSVAEAFPKPVFDNLTGQEITPEPERSLWPKIPDSELGGRADVAQCLVTAGLESKAQAYRNCYRCGRPFHCPKDGKKFFERFRCRMRFCPQCAHANATRLLSDIMFQLDPWFADPQNIRPDYVFLRINFTWRASGRPFSPDDVKKFNLCVKRTLKRALPLSKDRRMTFGYLLIDEVGFEYRGRRADRKSSGWNLHVHGLYYGPFFPWFKVRKLWVEETTLAFGVPSTGCPFSPVKNWGTTLRRSVLRALRHHTKYVDKIPGVSAERIAELEKSFLGTRRYRMGGIWYRLPHRKRREGNPSCPECANVAGPNGGVPVLVSDDVLRVRSRRTGKDREIPIWSRIEKLREAGYTELRCAEQFEGVWQYRGDPSP